MRVNTTKAKLAEGSVVFGGIISGYAPELVELGLEAADGSGSWSGGEPTLEGLVEAFDLPAGLGVVGP